MANQKKKIPIIVSNTKTTNASQVWEWITDNGLENKYLILNKCIGEIPNNQFYELKNGNGIRVRNNAFTSFSWLDAYDLVINIGDEFVVLDEYSLNEYLKYDFVKPDNTYHIEHVMESELKNTKEAKEYFDKLLPYNNYFYSGTISNTVERTDINYGKTVTYGGDAKSISGTRNGTEPTWNRSDWDFFTYIGDTWCGDIDLYTLTFTKNFDGIHVI